MPRGKGATFDQQRAAILNAAAQLFAQKGFTGASMADVARACGVSKPLLYHYYRDKRHLLYGAADSYLDRLVAISTLKRSRDHDADAHFRALVAAFMREYEHAQAQHIVLVQDVKYLGPAERAAVIAKQRRVVDAFAHAISALRPRLRDKALRVPLTMLLFGMINWTFTWLRPTGRLTYDDMAKVVADVFLHGVAPSASVRIERSPFRGSERSGARA
ncbi:MAG: TetR/AcrR family transcriptional regulator [Proteobacteria bacterium]|nr:MAG: TetR/AcrR family transcriptional regulator [Pseudomonadota bacterium]